MEGVSFVIRVKNEETTLDQTIRSLLLLQIPYEVIVVLNQCTDSSKKIAEQIQSEGYPISIVEYDIPVSRAGYETLATDATSPHSIVYYCNWCMSQVKYAWKFKWDADFRATDELIAFMNSRLWKQPTDVTRIYFNAISNGNVNTEGYLFSGDLKYRKYYFWEVLGHPDQYTKVYSDISIDHCSLVTTLKSYWTDDCWFYNENDTREETQTIRIRYDIIRTFCGEEPVGQARAHSKDNEPVFYKVQDKMYFFDTKGISASD